MDTITHALLGALTAQLGFRQKIGRSATWVAAAAAIAPDLDILLSPLLAMTGAEVGGTNHLTGHRGLTHSLLAAPILALPITIAWWVYKRRAAQREVLAPPRIDPSTHPEVAQIRQAMPVRTSPPPFLLLFACVLLAVLTHPLLDWCTPYGTELFAPITDHRYAFNCVPIIDIIFTPLLILALLLCWVFRKLGPDDTPRATTILGWAGFLLAVGYLGAGRYLHDRAVDRAVALAGPARVVRADAYPAMGSIFLWRAVVETKDSWLAYRLHSFAPPDAKPRSTSATKVSNEWIDRAKELPQVQEYLWFTNGWVRAGFLRKGGMNVVEFDDMRYGDPLESTQSSWPMRVLMDSSGNVVQVAHEHHAHGDLPKRITQMWSEIWNP